MREVDLTHQVLNDVDNCPLVANPGQEDDDSDGIGNACQVDCDGDAVLGEALFIPINIWYKTPRCRWYSSTKNIILY